MRLFARASFAVAPIVATVASIAACGGQSGYSSSFLGGEPPGTTEGDSADASTGGSTGSSTVSLTTPTSGGGGATGGSGSGATDGGTTTIGASCNAVSATAARAPLRLVVMLDRSGSMGKFTDQNQQPQDNTAVRWTPVTTALETFFEDPSSMDVQASLQFFPLGDDVAECNSNTYAIPSVDFTSLPVSSGSDPFTRQISQTQPAGATPTIEALAGALTYAIDTMKTDTSGAKYAVVFVTDGDPCLCSAGEAGCPGFVGSPEDTAAAQAVANLASQYASVIPTYVIGVGPDFANLNLIAAGGGTTSAIAVSIATSPTQTSTDLETALDKIRTTALSCDFVIPAAPSGQTYDINSVNVQYTPSGGSATTLPYDPTCSGSSGWHYDDPTAPTQIILCGSTCAGAQSGSGAAINVAFGCDTVGGIPGYDGGIVVR